MSKARHARPRRSSRRVVRTLSIAGLGAGITAAGAGGAFATDYTVKAGDTLSEIAQANGANWHHLARINHLKDPDLILIGQTLTLDGVRKSTAPHRIRKVEAKKIRTTERKVRTSRSADRPSVRVSLSGAWAKVANCESSGNPRAVNPAGYVGGSGNPINASAAEQLSRAKKLYAQRGASPWPVCGRYLR